MAIFVKSEPLSDEFQCNIGHFSVPDPFILNMKSKIITHKCGICESKFRTQIDLLSHICDGIKQVNFDSSEEDNSHDFHAKTTRKYIKKNKSSYNGKSNGKGIVAKKVYPSLSVWHRKQMSTCPFCKITVKSLANHMKTHSLDRPFTCATCGKAFKKYNALLMHIVTHSKEILYSCTICNRGFRHKSSYIRHGAQHSNEKPHVCPICKKTFSLRNSLKMHLIKHTEELPYACDFCSEKFACPRKLKAHLLTHDPNNALKCTTCGKQYTDRTHLNQHYLSCHRVNTIQCYKCDVCDRAFVQKYHLRRHLKSHRQ